MVQGTGPAAQEDFANGLCLPHDITRGGPIVNLIHERPSNAPKKVFSEQSFLQKEEGWLGRNLGDREWSGDIDLNLEAST